MGADDPLCSRNARAQEHDCRPRLFEFFLLPEERNQSRPPRFYEAWAIAAESLMNNAGEEGISEGFRLAKSERANSGGVGAEEACHPVSVAAFFRIRTMGRVGLFSWLRAAFPQLDGPVPRRTGQFHPVRRQSDASNASGMGLERSEATAVRQVPKPNRRVIAGADEYLAVRRDGERAHPAGMAFQRPLFRHMGHVEQLNRLVTAPGDQ